MTEASYLQSFRQRATAYVLRQRPKLDVEVLVMLHVDHPDAGVQVPGGGALAHETPGEAALREAFEETGVRGLAFGEVVGNMLLNPDCSMGVWQVSTYSWLTTTDDRDSWEHTVASADGDNGLRMRCEFRPAVKAGLDWNLDAFLSDAVARFARP
ncbi:NUDIX domain-containing protein [Glycomyces buryatensis]|uniref:NUDIX domain-containing protein n=1 Tax=Glycomyces buryatensis TaxID=2570927 RepID=UPI0014562D96|nr:NUDIX domain-containing protein [Glycomyces buryatensis]